MVIKTGQITLSATAQPLSSLAITPNVFEFRARVGNAARVYWGDNTVTTGTGYDLEAGEVYTIERRVQAGAGAYDIVLSNLFFVGNAGDVVSWVAFL